MGKQQGWEQKICLEQTEVIKGTEENFKRTETLKRRQLQEKNKLLEIKHILPL